MIRNASGAQKIALLFTIVVYISGIIGMRSAERDWFIMMTPFTLILSAAVLLWWQPMHTTLTRNWAIGAFTIGFLAEVIGVNTGLIFGNYVYGNVLGVKCWNTPILIGINWLLVTYCVNEGVWRILPRGTATFLGAILSAVLCTLFDYLVEPGAIALGYWSWNEGLPPIENYVGWFFVSLVISITYSKWMTPGLRNTAALVLLVLQILFFALTGVNW